MSALPFAFTPSQRLCCWLATLLLLFVGGAQPRTAAAPATGGLKRSFDVPAGVAETTLRIFAEQAGGQFIFSAAKVEGVRTHAVKGRLTAREALERMIADTDLQVVEDEHTRALTVDRPTPDATGPGRREKREEREAEKNLSPNRNGNR